MDKRYQVFVSSTYADLRNERQKIIQTLMEMDCIPSGMELFPAADEEQWAFIKKIIDDCDYYLLLIGGRYGSTTPEGISYTEKEYDYASSKGIRVVAFLHDNPDDIPAGKTDKDPALLEKLARFKEKAGQSRLVKFWRDASELPGLVALSLSKTIKTHPAVGWVRANTAGSTELLAEINALRKDNDELRKAIASTGEQKPVSVVNIAPLDDKIELYGDYKTSYGDYKKSWRFGLSWGEIFALISPHLLEHPNDGSVKIELKKSVLERAGIKYYESDLNDQIYQTVKIQLIAYGLVEVNYLQTTAGTMALFWNLTPRGKDLMIQFRSVRARK